MYVYKILAASESVKPSVKSCIASIKRIIDNYLKSAGFDNPSNLYEVSYYDDTIELSADFTLDDFIKIKPRLDGEIRKVSPDSDFYELEPGKFIANLGDDDKGDILENDEIFNLPNVMTSIEPTIELVEKQIGDKFEIDQISIDTVNYDSDSVRVYIEISGEIYSSVAYQDFYIDDVKSTAELKADFTDTMYRRLINNLREK